MNTRRALASVTAAVLAAGMLVASASAQAPVGGLACVAGPFDTQSGSTVDVSSVLRDAGGNVLTGGLIFYNIISQSGSDASLSAASATSDDSGTSFVTLSSGSTAGPVLVSATTEDGQQCMTDVQVSGAAARTSSSGALGGSDKYRSLGMVGVAAGILLVGLRGLQTAGPRRPSRA